MKFSEVKVGIFVFIALVIVVATMFWTKGFFIKKDQIDYKVYFPAVNGLSIGDPVSVNGVKSGKVTSIELEGDSVVVEFRLDKSVRLKKDYKIEVTMLEIMSGKQILITPGKSGELISPGTPLYGINSADFSEVVTNFSEISNDVKILIRKIGETNDNLNKAINNINDITGDENMKSGLKTTVANLKNASENLNLLLRENRGSFRKITEKIDSTVGNVNTLFDESNPKIKTTFEDIKTLSVKADSLIGNLNVIISDIQTKKSGVGKFIYDDKFFENLNRTVTELEKLVRQIRKKGVKINLF